MLLIEIAEQYAESAERVQVQIQRLRAAEPPSPYIENKMREVYRDLRRAEKACRSYYERLSSKTCWAHKGFGTRWQRTMRKGFFG